MVDMTLLRKSQSVLHQGYLCNLRESRSLKSMLYVFNSQSNLLEYNPMQDYIDLISREIKRQGITDLALFSDLAHRTGFKGIQEWLSFFYKSPQVGKGLYPEHDLHIQKTKFKNTLRVMAGEALITHLGLDYYEQK